MSAHGLAEVEQAIRASWSAETSYASTEYLALSSHPARGQCGTTALVVHELLGGVLLCASLSGPYPEGAVHYWNRLPDGAEVDLTTGQLQASETLGEARVIERPGMGAPGPAREAWQLLRARVLARLAEPG